MSFESCFQACRNYFNFLSFDRGGRTWNFPKFQSLYKGKLRIFPSPKVCSMGYSFIFPTYFFIFFTYFIIIIPSFHISSYFPHIPSYFPQFFQRTIDGGGGWDDTQILAK